MGDINKWIGNLETDKWPIKNTQTSSDITQNFNTTPITDRDKIFLKKHPSAQNKVLFGEKYRDIGGIKIPRAGILSAHDVKNIPGIVIYPSSLIFYDKFSLGSKIDDFQKMSPEEKVHFLQNGRKLFNSVTFNNVQWLSDAEMQRLGIQTEIMLGKDVISHSLDETQWMIQNNKLNSYKLDVHLIGNIQPFDGVRFDHRTANWWLQTRFFMQVQDKIQDAFEKGLVDFRPANDQDREKIKNACGSYNAFFVDLLGERCEWLDQDFNAIHSRHSSAVIWSNSNTDKEWSCIEIHDDVGKYRDSKQSGYIHNLARWKEKTLLAGILPVLDSKKWHYQ